MKNMIVSLRDQHQLIVIKTNGRIGNPRKKGTCSYDRRNCKLLEKKKGNISCFKQYISADKDSGLLSMSVESSFDSNCTSIFPLQLI